MELEEFRIYSKEEVLLAKQQRDTVREYLVECIMDAHNEIVLNKKDSIKYPIVTEAKKKKTMNICISDNHFGEIINRNGEEVFNLDIASKRTDYLIDRAIQEMEIQGKKNFNEVVINIGGDNIEGDGNIFMHQIYSINDSPWIMIQTFVNSVIKGIKKLSVYMGKNGVVRVFGIAGNHGQIRTRFVNHPIINNYDTLGYIQMLSIIKYSQQQKLLKNVSLTFSMEKGYLDYKVKGHTFFMIHKMGKNLISPAQKTKVLETFQRLNSHSGVHISGHFHETLFAPIGQHTVIRVGALPGANDYTDELGIASKGSEQLLFTTTEESQVENFMPIKMEHIK